jgi:hypothetical protein
MKAWVKSLLTENEGNISVGSVCIFSLMIVYIIIFVLAFILNKKIPVSGYEIGSIIGALYAIKKIPKIWEGKNKNDVSIGY